jgi:hypothetical protein
LRAHSPIVSEPLLFEKYNFFIENILREVKRNVNIVVCSPKEEATINNHTCWKFHIK